MIRRIIAHRRERKKCIFTVYCWPSSWRFTKQHRVWHPKQSKHMRNVCEERKKCAKSHQRLEIMPLVFSSLVFVFHHSRIKMQPISVELQSHANLFCRTKCFALHCVYLVCCFCLRFRFIHIRNKSDEHKKRFERETERKSVSVKEKESEWYWMQWILSTDTFTFARKRWQLLTLNNQIKKKYTHTIKDK